MQLSGVIKPQLSQKIAPPLTVGEKDPTCLPQARMSTPIPTFPYHKGEGDEIRNILFQTMKVILSSIILQSSGFVWLFLFKEVIKVLL